MPPTHFDRGNVTVLQPYEVSQSGTERPEPVLVAKLPTRTRRTVEAASLANQWGIVLNHRSNARADRADR
jgi:hypothetical protein